MKPLLIRTCPPLLLVVLLICAMQITAYLFPPTWENMTIFFIAASFTALVALSIIGIALYQFRAHRTSVDPISPNKARALLTHGIFSRSRNPMYLGFSLILFSAVFYSAVMLNILFVLVFLFYMSKVQIPHEELALHELFDEEYASYKKRVPRWI